MKCLKNVQPSPKVPGAGRRGTCPLFSPCFCGGGGVGGGVLYCIEVVTEQIEGILKFGGNPI